MHMLLTFIEGNARRVNPKAVKSAVPGGGAGGGRSSGGTGLSLSLSFYTIWTFRNLLMFYTLKT